MEIKETERKVEVLSSLGEFYRKNENIQSRNIAVCARRVLEMILKLE